MMQKHLFWMDKQLKMLKWSLNNGVCTKNNGEDKIIKFNQNANNFDGPFI